MKFSQLPAGLSFDDKTRIMMMAINSKKLEEDKIGDFGPLVSIYVAYIRLHKSKTTWI
jgi:hypothetical protein